MATDVSNKESLGTWSFSDYRISLIPIENDLTAKITRLQNPEICFSKDQVACGVMGITSHQVLIEKINTLGKEKFAVLLFPKEHPTECWVFEAMAQAIPDIRKGKEFLKEAKESQRPLSFYEKALGCFITATKIQQKFGGDTKELDQAIIQIKKNILLVSLEQKAPNYLPNAQEIEKFQEIVDTYKDDDILAGFDVRLSIEETKSPHQHLISAVIHEEKEAYLLALESYLQLSEDNPNALACIEKAYDLLDKACKNDPDLLMRKEGVRVAFEKQLAILSQNSPQEQAPTCFICFNVEEKDVGHWLEKTLVPDLDKAGIKPIFCFRDLSPGQDLAPFQQLARNADIVMCVFTPDVKKKCQERQKAPTGIAQEIRIIQERFNDEDKFNKIFPIYLKGSRSEVNPTPYFEPIFGSKFSPFDEEVVFSEFNYFSNAFDLLFAMREVSREESRKTRDSFLEEAQNSLKGDLNLEEVKKWRAEKESRAQILRDSIVHRVSNLTQLRNLPLPRPNFIGRQQELKSIHEACQHKHRIAITALGGMGKTSLAIQYGNIYKAHYQFIHFMQAGSSQLVINGLLKLADDLHIPQIEKAEDRLARLKITLDRYEKEYLIIFDGIDQEEVFQTADKYLPERGHCILLTSRMPEQVRIRGFHLIGLDPLSLEEAVKFLLESTGSKENDMAPKLAEKLGRLPLALTHAAGYIRSQGTTIEKYLTLFEDHNVKLFKDKYLTLLEGEKTILTTWQISMEAIAKTDVGPLSQGVLNFFAFLAQAPIPCSLIDAWYKNFYPVDNELSLEQALIQLCNYSMINGVQDVYHIHALVQKVTEYQMCPKTRKKYFDRILSLSNSQINRYDSSKVEDWPGIKDLLPHAEAFINKAAVQNLSAIPAGSQLTESENVADDSVVKFESALSKACVPITVCPLLETPDEFSTRSFKAPAGIAENLSRDFKLDLADLADAIGLCFQLILGNYKDAHKFFQIALKNRQELLEGEDNKISQSYNNIGRILELLGDYKTALFYLEKALEITIKLLGEEHPNTA